MVLGYNIGAQLAGQPGEERVPNHCLAEHPIFLPLGATMNYQRHYDLLINRARTRVLDGYKERHHIVPRCLGGGDESSNLVDLTAEEHYVAHQLLVKMYPGNNSVVVSAWLMGVSGGSKQVKMSLNNGSRSIEMRKLRSKIMKNRVWITDGTQDKLIVDTNELPKGWVKGRTFAHGLNRSQ